MRKRYILYIETNQIQTIDNSSPILSMNDIIHTWYTWIYIYICLYILDFAFKTSTILNMIREKWSYALE